MSVHRPGTVAGQVVVQSLLCSGAHRLVSWCRFTLLTPDLLRADAEENIYVQAYGLASAVTVSILIRDFSKTTMILQDSVKLGPDNSFQALKSILVTPGI